MPNQTHGTSSNQGQKAPPRTDKSQSEAQGRDQGHTAGSKTQAGSQNKEGRSGQSS